MNIVDQIFEAGIVGAGGAGFPSHIKFSTKAEWLLVNAAECEPLIHSDKYLIRNRTQDLVQVLLELAQLIEASHIVIAIKKTNREEIAALEEAVKGTNIKLCFMDNFYPAGDEQVLIYEATGKRVPIGGLPKDIGVVVSNVGTLCSIYDALQGKNNTRRILSIVGEVSLPLIIDAPIGTPLVECIAAAKPLNSRYSVILGGPMMGSVYTFEEIPALHITKTVNSIIVLPENHYLETRAKKNIPHMINEAMSACIQCRMCTDLCPRFLLGHPLHPHRVMRSIPYGGIQEKPVFEEALLCCECGVCDYVCPMHLSPRRINQMVKKELAGKKSISGELRGVVHVRDYRILGSERLYKMIDVIAYKKQKPTETVALCPNKVSIALKQHIGKVAQALVKIGDTVKEGALIAGVSRQEMGANIHASISGTVSFVDGSRIEIERCEDLL